MAQRQPPFHLIYFLRLLNALTLTTFFQPDEFFQSLEPAWDLAFGPKSGAWITWEWHHQLRSSLHPILFSAFYKLVDGLCSIFSHSKANDTLRASALLAAPRVLQAVIAAVGDYFTYRLAATIYGPSQPAALTALLLQLASPWQWYVSTRTFSNSLETTLTVVALTYYPWSLLSASTTTKENPKATRLTIPVSHIRLSLSLAALAVVLRPTNLFIWTPIAIATVLRSFNAHTLTFVREIIICGPVVLALSIVADRWFFGFWTFPPWRWLNFNVSKSLAVFYGRNPWHYYLFQGIPLLCTTSLPFVLQALWRPKSPDNDISGYKTLALRTLSWAVYTTCITLSLISHKEVRFIYPLLPALNVLAAPYVASFFTVPNHPRAKTRPSTSIRRKPSLFAALGVNLLLAGYLSIFHQPAPLSVLHFLRNDFARIHQPEGTIESTSASSSPLGGVLGEDEELFALFLMPCHSTPWRSHLLYPNLHARALTCEPPLHTQPNTPERDLYRDEADRFYDTPLDFLANELFAPSSFSTSAPVHQRNPAPVPRYIIGFEGIEPWLRDFTQQTEVGQALDLKLERVWEGFNGLFNEDWRRAGKMVVWDTGRYNRGSPERTNRPERS
ncbi:alg9-like mannosyltransferase family protein [Sarocladium implicatum]|nr:alg9-like mannosyltransferase family protein [Sarocladium implicatum]